MITKLKPNYLKWIFVTTNLGVAAVLAIKDAMPE
jgi:hypothetical protein